MLTFNCSIFGNLSSESKLSKALQVSLIGWKYKKRNGLVVLRWEIMWFFFAYFPRGLRLISQLWADVNAASRAPKAPLVTVSSQRLCSAAHTQSRALSSCAGAAEENQIHCPLKRERSQVKCQVLLPLKPSPQGALPLQKNSGNKRRRRGRYSDASGTSGCNSN